MVLGPLGLNMKRIISLLLVIFLVITSIQSVEINASTSVLIIHYNREDEDYTPWNIWAWKEGGEGFATPFEYEDDFGKVAIIPLPLATTSAGFIIRTDNWDKDIGTDRMVELIDGKAEIWVYSGVEEFETQVPEGFEPWNLDLESESSEETTIVQSPTDDLTVRVH